MNRLTRGVWLLLAGACGSDPAAVDGGADGAPQGPALVVPAVISLPYVAAGAGESMIEVTVSNPGTAEVGALSWTIDAAGFTASGPERIGAGESAALVVRWAGSAAPAIAAATLTVDGDAGARTAEVWAVAGDPALPAADFQPVIGAGGVDIGDSAVLGMPTAPFPAPSGPWTDDRVHIFVPAGWRERAAQDLVIHFHGHSTTIDATVPGHRYREHVYASGADVILVVPQGPVDAASGDFGKLNDPAGTAAFVDEVLTVLYRAGVVTRPAPGRLILTSHSGGYAAVARNLGDARLPVAQVDLFDSLYGFVSTYLDFALTGALLRSNYTATGGTDGNNLALLASLEDAAADVADAPTQRNLRDVGAVVYFTAASHGGATRDDGAYGEQLRWGARHARRGPRAELRSAVAAGGTATVSWLAPPEEDLSGWRVETSADGQQWTEVARAEAGAEQISFPLTAGARVRLVPVVDAVADPQPSDVARVDPDADILIVDGFDRVIDGSWGGLAHDFAAVVGEAAGPVHTASNEAITEDGFALAGYRAVIWLLGDESTDDHSFTAAERAALDAYLAGGGHLIISGSEVGFDLGGSSAGAAWLAGAAGAVYASDDAGVTAVAGTGPLASVAGFGFAGPTAPYAEEFPDTLTATGAGVVLLRYSTAAAAAVGIPGRAALVGFPLELIDDAADLAAVVAALIAFVAP